jgi:predicted CXXCH cytochrome family protein
MMEKKSETKKKEKHMRKFFLLGLSLFVGLLLVSTSFATTVPGSGITDSYHDLGTTSATYGDATEQANAVYGNRICIYCHAPHNTIKLGSPEAVDGMGVAVEYLPLWNHTITTMPGYMMYDNGPAEPASGDANSYAKANATSPTGVSILCLSCHDGSVATNAYGTGTGAVGAADKFFLAGTRGLIGGLNATTGLGDLSNHHPISFDYAAAAAADAEILPATSPFVTATGTETIADHLFGGQLECASCHDVHNGPSVAGVRLTYVNDARSAFCLTCHDK